MESINMENINFVKTEYGKKEVRKIDGMDVYKHYVYLFKSLENKNDAYFYLLEELCLLIHFISEKNPEYVEFLNKFRSEKNKTDDSLLEEEFEIDIEKDEIKENKGKVFTAKEVEI